ncbi:hypothetical protein DY037_01355 [Apilactobacillus micheneri]|uniref:hypothetical protein n=1 Tax=Apilactobacillus micheneri TaxID=1899430 RepID=UPI00112B610F|nr:hypothetical protein [Apilactobacillus micheneri]TPR50625.1 hypothetical protein DY037_01355 [Apilactobacillus micheneri]
MLFNNKKTYISLLAGLTLFSSVGVNAFADNGAAPTKGTTAGYVDNSNPAKGTADMGKVVSGGSGKNDNIQASSDAHISIVNGYLVLETVPSLGFQDVSGKTGDTQSNTVKDNNTVLRSDTFYNSKENPNPTDLYVQDARPDAKDGGYSVNATLGNFGTYNDGGTLTPLSDTGQASDFNLNLNGSLSKDSTNVGNPTAAQNVSLPSDNKTTQTVLSNSKQGSLNSKVNFNAGSTLTVPQGIAQGNYAAPITWTLVPSTASAGADSGGHGGTTPGTTPGTKK